MLLGGGTLLGNARVILARGVEVGYREADRQGAEDYGDRDPRALSCGARGLCSDVFAAQSLLFCRDFSHAGELILDRVLGLQSLKLRRTLFEITPKGIALCDQRFSIIPVAHAGP